MGASMEVSVALSLVVTLLGSLLWWLAWRYRALVRDHRRLSAAFDALPDPVTVYDAEGHGELKNRQASSRSATGRDGWAWEPSLNRKVFYDRQVVPLVPEQAGIRGVVEIARDITPWMENHEALSGAEANLRNLFDRAVEGFFQLDSQGRLLTANPALARLLGFEDVGALFRHGAVTPLDFLADQRERERFGVLLAETGVVRGFEAELVGLQKRRLWVSINGRTVRDAVLGRVAFEGSLLDVSERRAMEQELRIANEFNQTLVYSSPAFFMAVGADGRILRMNETMLKALGRREDEVVGQEYLQAIIPVEDRASVGRVFGGVGAAPEVLVTSTRVVCHDGRLLTVEWHGVPVFREAQFQFFIGVGINITDRVRAEAELERHRDRLEELVETRTKQLAVAKEAADAANQAKSLFLANMSHEIRTPMNAVLGFAQLLDRDSSLSPSARNHVATILKSGEHLLSIINDVLEMSRIEAGRIELREEPVDLGALLDDLAELFRMKAAEKNLELNLVKSPDLPSVVITDLGKLRQVLVNLLGNAVKFTLHGGITLKARSGGPQRVLIEVEDTGIGIASGDAARLFTPFERVSGAEKVAGGTGLGLSISRRYARLMAGEITVESQPGQGSRFRFEFRASAASGLPSTPGQGPPVVGLEPGQTDVKVLVVDDQPSNRELLRDLLEPLGFPVLEAADGEEALRLAAEWHPRIILMDLRMPILDGYEATRRLRDDVSGPPAVVIGVTASSLEEERQRFLESGLDAFLSKPFRAAELLDLLSRLAGVRFRYGEVRPSPSTGVPSIEGIDGGWRTRFSHALAEGDLALLKALAAEQRERRPELSSWLLQQIGDYNLNELHRIEVAHG